MTPTIRFTFAMLLVGFLHLVANLFLAIAKVAAVLTGLIYVTVTDLADLIERWGVGENLQNVDRRE